MVVARCGEQLPHIKECGWSCLTTTPTSHISRINSKSSPQSGTVVCSKDADRMLVKMRTSRNCARIGPTELQVQLMPCVCIDTTVDSATPSRNQRYIKGFSRPWAVDVLPQLRTGDSSLTHDAHPAFQEVVYSKGGALQVSTRIPVIPNTHCSTAMFNADLHPFSRRIQHCEPSSKRRCETAASQLPSITSAVEVRELYRNDRDGRGSLWLVRLVRLLKL